MIDNEYEVLRHEVKVLTKQVSDLRADVHSLVEAWHLGTGVLRIIQFVAIVAGGFVALAGLLHLAPKGL